MPVKVDYADLESVTKLLDKLIKNTEDLSLKTNENKDRKEAIRLSKMIKDKYTEIKPDYDRTN